MKTTTFDEGERRRKLRIFMEKHPEIMEAIRGAKGIDDMEDHWKVLNTLLLNEEDELLNLYLFTQGTPQK